MSSRRAVISPSSYLQLIHNTRFDLISVRSWWCFRSDNTIHCADNQRCLLAFIMHADCATFYFLLLLLASFTATTYQPHRSNKQSALQNYSLLAMLAFAATMVGGRCCSCCCCWWGEQPSCIQGSRHSKRICIAKGSRVLLTRASIIDWIDFFFCTHTVLRQKWMSFFWILKLYLLIILSNW